MSCIFHTTLETRTSIYTIEQTQTHVTQNPVPVFPRAPSLTGSLHVFMITFWGMGMTCIAIGHTSEADVEGCKG